MINCPGGIHDSKLAASGSLSIYTKIDQLYKDYRVKCIMDLVFAMANQSSIIKAKKRESITSTAASQDEFEELVTRFSVH